MYNCMQIKFFFTDQSDPARKVYIITQNTDCFTTIKCIALSTVLCAISSMYMFINEMW